MDTNNKESGFVVYEVITFLFLCAVLLGYAYNKTHGG